VGVVPRISLWWLLTVPVILVVWVILTRFSVRVVNRHLLHLMAELDRGNDEPTKLIESPAIPVTLSKPQVYTPKTEMSVDMTRPVRDLPPLSDPLSVSPVTYVSQPSLPRSMRRVDISAIGGDSRFPVTADNPQDALPLYFGEVPDSEEDTDELPHTRYA